jgi:hypothetical protein
MNLMSPRKKIHHKNLSNSSLLRKTSLSLPLTYSQQSLIGILLRLQTDRLSKAQSFDSLLEKM